MDNPHIKLSLVEKILIFVGYCLPEINYKFSYQKMKAAFLDLDEADYSISTLRKEISNLKKQGLLAVKKRYSRKLLILTRNGRLLITPKLLHQKFDPWDDKWRLVIYSIPEKYRHDRLALQDELLALNFCKIRKGVFISPYPLLGAVRKFATRLGIRQYLILVKAQEIDQEKKAIQKIWKLDEINKEYEKFIYNVKWAIKQDFWPLRAKLLEAQFEYIFRLDPHLPVRLLPKKWHGSEAYVLYKKIIKTY